MSQRRVFGSGFLQDIIGGLMIGLVGLVIMGLSTLASYQADRFADMLVPTFGELQATASGADVLIGGSISSRNRTIHESLVAYVYQKRVPSRDSDEEDEWRTHSSSSPSLLIDMPGGTIQVTRGYKLEDPPRTIQGRRRDERYAGFAVGSQVMIEGQLASGSGPPQVNARSIASGSPEYFVQGQRNSGWCLIGLGALFLLLGLYTTGYRIFEEGKKMFGK